MLKCIYAYICVNVGIFFYFSKYYILKDDGVDNNNWKSEKNGIIL